MPDEYVAGCAEAFVRWVGVFRHREPTAAEVSCVG